MHDDFFDLFRHFWWLIFPIFGMITAWLHMNQRHDRTNKVLDMIKSYADQGKEPPPELMAALREANFGGAMQSQPNWLPVFLFAGLAVGFGMFALWDGGDMRHNLPYLFVALVMAAMAIGSFFNKISKKRGT